MKLRNANFFVLIVIENIIFQNIITGNKLAEVAGLEPASSNYALTD